MDFADWTNWVVTLSFMGIGYLIGSWSNAIMILKLFGLEDVRKKGSGNAGATNVLRNYGKKFAMIVFVLDFMKTVIAILLAYIAKDFVFLPAVGVAVVVGHIYPIFFDFKGGKGAACLFGLFLITNWVIALIGVFFFLIIIKVSKTVAVGSLVTPPILILIFGIAVGLNTTLAHAWAMPVMTQFAWYVPFSALIISYLLVVWKHRSNIKRLFEHKENKLRFG